MEPHGILGRLAVGQGDVVPVLIARVEGSAHIQDIDAEPVEDAVLGLGQLLDHVIQPGMPGSDPQMPLQVPVTHGRNSGAGSGPQIDRHPVRLPVLNGRKDPFS